MAGALIAFEGLDQSGKATQTALLKQHFESAGREVRVLAFPDYGTTIGREIAAALRGERAHGPDVLQLLYIANRYEYRAEIEGWLRQGCLVICDRYTASSVAYGASQGLDEQWLADVQRNLPRTHLTILLDIPPTVGAVRKSENRDAYERDMDLLTRVRESYQRQARHAGWVSIDGTQPREVVAQEVQRAARSRLSLP
ncbi:MAG: dTMP kinase [Vicinamibacterales bacterium]